MVSDNIPVCWNLHLDILLILTFTAFFVLILLYKP